MIQMTMGALFFALVLSGCNQGDTEMVEKARIEGKAAAEAALEAQLQAKDQLIEKARAEGAAAAEAGLQVQLRAKDQLLERARAEGKAVAEEELHTQIANLDLLKKKAFEEGKAAAEAQIGSQNENTAKKAATMEADLASRQLFYQAVKGTYEGTLQASRGIYNVRLTFVPTVPPYLSDRVRQLDEIASDLSNLTFNVHVVQWNPANPMAAVGCRIERVRPDIRTGLIAITSEGCLNSYQLQIADPEVRSRVPSKSHKPSDPNVARETASAIATGKLTSVAEILGEIHPTTTAAIYPIAVKRVENR